MIPWFYSATIAAVLSFASAWQIQNWRYEALDNERVQQAAAEKDANDKKADAAAESHEVAKDQVRSEFQIIYRDVNHVVEKPVYRNVCFDDDGLRLIRKATGKPDDASSEPAATVP